MSEERKKSLVEQLAPSMNKLSEYGRKITASDSELNDLIYDVQQKIMAIDLDNLLQS